jgi:hypothetical protein
VRKVAGCKSIVRGTLPVRKAWLLPKLTVALILPLAFTGGCKRRSSSHAADAGAAPGIAHERIEAVNNATKQSLYSGPTGVVEGTVTIMGDESPDLLPYLEKIPADCAAASRTYGKFFREGTGRTVADVMVAVTGYRGYVKPRSDRVLVHARDCAWEKRTIALTFGQRIDVQSDDNRPYIPQLLGARMEVMLVAVPKNDAVPLLPPEPGHYVLIDAMRLYSKADVFVVRYPTVDVTGLDGRYRIEGIPPGPATVSALLPSVGATTQGAVTIKTNGTEKLDLTLHFDRAKFNPRASARAPAQSLSPDASTPAAPPVP